MANGECVGTIVCKLDVHKSSRYRGYIAMLATRKDFRKRGIGSTLVLKALAAMQQASAQECVLETELTNKGALRLYENLGFVRHKRLQKYYLNGVDAFRLKLWFPTQPKIVEAVETVADGEVEAVADGEVEAVADDEAAAAAAAAAGAVPMPATEVTEP